MLRCSFRSSHSKLLIRRSRVCRPFDFTLSAWSTSPKAKHRRLRGINKVKLQEGFGQKGHGP
ncbi:unnamed protein product [Ectocarpus sp. 12 AP-2014]